jgi:hypothetical protein
MGGADTIGRWQTRGIMDTAEQGYEHDKAGTVLTMQTRDSTNITKQGQY